MNPPETREEKLLKKWSVEEKWLGKNVLGLCSWEEKKIYINLAAHLIDTIVHEVLHATRPKYDPTDKERDDAEHEVIDALVEKRVRQLSPYLIRRIVKNYLLRSVNG